MPDAGIDYQRLTALGGLRHSPAAQETINGAWRNRSFRNYADYLQTSEFAAAVDDLIALAKTQTVVIMGLTSTKPHTVTSFAKADGDRVWCPAEE